MDPRSMLGAAPAYLESCCVRLNSSDITTLLTTCLEMSGVFRTERSSVLTWRMLPTLRWQTNLKK